MFRFRGEICPGVLIAVHDIKGGHIVSVLVDAVEPDIDPQKDRQSDGDKQTVGKESAGVARIQTGGDKGRQIHSN